MLRPAVSRPDFPGVRLPTGSSDQFFFLLEIFFTLLCSYEVPSLTKRTGLQFTVAAGPRQHSPSRVFILRDSRSDFTPIVTSLFPLTWIARFQYLCLPRTGLPSYTPRHWVCLIHLYDSHVISIILYIQYIYCVSFSLARYSSRFGYNGSLVSRPVLRLTAAKLKPLIFSLILPQVQVTMRMSVSRPVRLGVGPMTRF
jgi:hypothetical protein